MDEFCKAVLNTFLTLEDFIKMNIEKSKIHLIELKNNFYNLDELKEDLVIYISYIYNSTK